MFKIATSAFALATIFSISSAIAADIDRSVDPTSVASEQPFSWTGGYLGAQIGYGIASQNVTTLSTEHFDATLAEDVTTKTYSEGSDSGFVGGLQIGFDKQLGRIVLGVFGDVNWSEIAGKNHDWTIGARAGFLVDPRLMVYGLAGFTKADFDEADYQGWTLGAGLEYAVTRNIFVGGKYTYTDYDNETLVDTPALTIDSDRDEHRILADIKIKFNGDFGF